jgi:hypothetical protein
MKPVYLIGPVDGAYKIGQSQDPEARLAQFNLPFEPAIVAIVTTSRKGWLEPYMHAAFAHRRIRGEWFRLTHEEVVLFCSVPHADSPDDLPAAVVALHGANLAAKPKRTTIAVSLEFGRKLTEAAHDRGLTVAEYCDKHLSEKELHGEFARLDFPEATS